MQYIHGKIGFLRVFLEDHSSPNSNEGVKRLEERARDAAYAAEDIIDSHVSKQLLSKATTNEDKWYELFCQDLQKVIEEIDAIHGEVIKIQESYSISNLQSTGSLPAESSRTVCSVENDVVGHDEKLMQIKEQLMGLPSKLEIISIVGMGGISKTALAANVYNDPFITYYFYIRAWVSISQEHNLRAILVGLLSSMKKPIDKLKEGSNEQLAEYLYRSLKGNRYLIVMDDVWDTEVWDYVERLFPNDNNGSRIMLTSRLDNVAIYVNSNGLTHRVRFLSTTESWNLLPVLLPVAFHGFHLRSP
ncbi:UNVERIFIED_CONTAM: putative late blight resistance proteinR1A-10 [Sesamum latifolium]|uniref:Late blight resistance proteinR1A-10 n=1 Tax=Sesamum latifolium TaxID=2727402 RepID=A0AAW2UJX2_9LAMI